MAISRFTRQALWLCIFVVSFVPARAAEITPGFEIKPVSLDAPINEQPYFGFARKTEAQKQADAQFVYAITEKGQKDRAQVAEAVVITAWKFLRRQDDAATAAKRFNQAWLLDPGRSDIAHGFAIIVFERFQNTEYSLRLFEIAARLRKPIPPLPSDHARVLMRLGRHAEAIPLLLRAIEMAPGWHHPYSQLATAYLETGKAKEACETLKRVPANSNSAIQGDVDIIRKRANCQ